MMFRKYYFVNGNAEFVTLDYEVIEILSLGQGVKAGPDPGSNPGHEGNTAQVKSMKAVDEG